MLCLHRRKLIVKPSKHIHTRINKQIPFRFFFFKLKLIRSSKTIAKSESERLNENQKENKTKVDRHEWCMVWKETLYAYPIS